MRATPQLRSFCVLAALSAVLCAVSGCGVQFQKRQQEILQNSPESDWGSRPPYDHFQREKEHVLGRLKDPDSAQFRQGSVERGVVPAGFWDPEPVLVWLSRFEVNAKNAFGGYTGYKPYVYLWKESDMYGATYPSSSAGSNPIIYFKE